MNKKMVNILAGTEKIQNLPMQPFSAEAMDFLEELSKRIRKSRDASIYPDVVTFGFYCRKANLEYLKEAYKDYRNCLGRGILFHIAPSNVPINFAFSFVFGLLAGNCNIVRVSSKQFPQVYLLCDILKKILEEKEYEGIKIRTSIVEYEKNKDLTDYYSSICNGRIMWGGDRTIQEIRTSPIPVRSIEVTFADRYSLGIINPDRILSMTEKEIERLAQDFYKDTYLFDQNACSTPHLIVWKATPECKKDTLNMAKQRFWNSVFNVAKKYDLEDIKVSEKYSMLCEIANSMENIENIKQYENLLYVVSLQSFIKDKEIIDITQYRGKFGLFYELTIHDLEEILPYLNEKVQTIATEGIKPKIIQEWILKHSVRGVDRIVPFGKTVDIGLVWDGYDLVQTLSRRISLT